MKWPLPTIPLLLLVAFPLLAASQGAVNILIFYRTTGYVHASIPDAIAAVEAIAVARSWTIHLETNNASLAFDPATLSQVNVVVFALTTGTVFDDTNQQEAFKTFINNGNGWVGLHSASDTEHTWSWYEGLVGAYFANHPSIQTATLQREDDQHPSTSPYPDTFTRHDEWYNFQTNPRDNGAHVLLRLDEQSYSGGNMGADHPIAWCKEYDGGRAWYTAGGHTSASYAETQFVDHIEGGIEWVAKLSNASCAPNSFPGGNTQTDSPASSLRAPFMEWFCCLLKRLRNL